MLPRNSKLFEIFSILIRFFFFVITIATKDEKFDTNIGVKQVIFYQFFIVLEELMPKFNKINK